METKSTGAKPLPPTPRPAAKKFTESGLPDYSILNPRQQASQPPKKPRIKIPFGIILKILFFAVLPAYLIQRYFLYIDMPHSCFITIRPSIASFSNLEMKRGLQLLRQTLPDDYQTVCARVSGIDPNFGCGGFGGGCFFPAEQQSRNKGLITVSTNPGNTAATAAVIVHETCHAVQFHENRKFDENECHTEDDRVLKAIVDY